MIYIGVDPGKKGAIAILRPGLTVSECVSVQAMPTIKIGKRDEYNVDLIAATLLSQWGDMRREIFVTIERQQPMPASMGGGFANYARGQASGFEWILIAAGVNHVTVPPRVWQKNLHAGVKANDTKKRSILAAEQLFPGVPLQRGRSRKMDDGFADALLIAEFGRRLNEGGLK